MLVRRLRRRGGDGGKQREEVVPPKGGGFGSGTRARSSRPSVALAHRTCTHGSQLQAGQCGSGCPGAPLADLSTKVPPFFARPPQAKYSSPQGASYLRAAGEEIFQDDVRRLVLCGDWAAACAHLALILAGQCLQLRLLEQLAASRASLATTLVCSAPTCRRQTVSVERAYGTVRNRFTGERGT